MLIQEQYNKFFFTGNLNRGENVNGDTTMYFIIEEAKESILDFSQSVNLFYFNIITV